MLNADTFLPEQRLGMPERKRTLLLVDDEENILSALKRLLRREGYDILTATSGEQGLEVLAANEVDVILSDQRMPGMIGVEFLRRAKDMCPSTIRMVLSGYTELQSVTSAINEGAVYKFLTKPWDDEQLRQNIAEAFHHKDLSDENERLAAELKAANQDLALVNARLEALLAQKQQQIVRDETALGVFQEVLQMLPWPLIGIDDLGAVAAVNEEAEALFGEDGILLGMPVSSCLPPDLIALVRGNGQEATRIQIKGKDYQTLCRSMGLNSTGRGKVVILFPQETQHA